MLKFPGAQAPVPAATEPMAAKDLRALRARAHALKPVVWIGSSGPTEGVVRELDRALAVHELVKIHAAMDDRKERSRLLQSLCEALGAQPVQAIGKMLVAFRARPASTEAPAPQKRTGEARGERRARKSPPKRARASGPTSGRTRISAASGKAAAAATARMRRRSP
jgi:putative YhbY family RNA-binding protein